MGSMVSFVKKGHGKRPNWILFGVVTLLLGCLVVFNLEVTVDQTSPLSPGNRVCRDDATLSVYLLKTKLGVSYQGSHWFHVAENFMAYHSALRAQGRQTCAQRVLYLFDKDQFSDELNGVTKLMIALGTVADPALQSCPHQKQGQPDPSSRNFYFGRLRIDWAAADLEVGRSVALARSAFSELKVEQLTPGVATDMRLVSKQLVDVTGASPHTALRAVRAGNNSSSVVNSNELAGTLWSGDPQATVCARVEAVVGGAWPTPQRGHWFPLPEDVLSFRRKISALCPKDPVSLQKYAKTRAFKMVIYQRDLSRKLDSLEDSLVLLRERLPEAEWEIQVVMHKKDRSPCELAHLLSGVDVLLTPHGFQSMLLLFLPRPAVLFEVFPYRYFKRGYGPLSAEYGIIHSGIMSPPLTLVAKYALSFVRTEYCMASKLCRGYARDTDVRLTSRGVDALMKTISAYKTVKSSTQLDSFYL